LNAFPSQWQLHGAARWIRAGGVVAYHTEAVSGLACDPGNGRAVERLPALKHRSPAKRLILIASDWQQLQPWLASAPDAWHARLRDSRPSPITWLIPASQDCPTWLTCCHRTLPVRITAHQPVRRLCQTPDSAIVSKSANRPGQCPARSVLEARLQFGCQIDFVLPGLLGALTRPTEIRDLATGTVFRN